MTTPKIRIRLKAYDHKLLDQSAGEIVETAKRTGAKVAGPIPLPTQINKSLRAALAARRQEVARAVRDPHAQAPARHPRADPADAGRADEARPLGRRRRRDQDLNEQAEASPCRSTSSTSQARRSAARPRRRRLRRRGERAPPVGGGEGAAGRGARRHAQDQDARRGPRRRQEAVEAEGHRQRAPGLDRGRRTSSAAARCSARSRATTRTRCRRRCKRAALALGAVAARAGEEAGHRRQVRARRPKTKTLAGIAQDAGRRAGASSSTAKDNVNLVEVGAQPARRQGASPPEGLNVYDILNHPSLVIAAGRRQGDRGARPGRAGRAEKAA